MTEEKGYTLEEILSKYKEEIKKKINICDIFGFVEVNHSAFLAYLFNRNETHGEGNLFFKIFLKEIGLPVGYAEEDYIVEREAQLDTEDKQNNSGKGGKNKSRVDIRIYCEKEFIINIEVKVGSPLNEQQIKAEDEDLEIKAKNWNISDEGRFGIFISLLKEDKERFKDCNCNWRSVEWSTIKKCLDEFLKEAQNERIKKIVEEYLEYIKKNFMLTLNENDILIFSNIYYNNNFDKLKEKLEEMNNLSEPEKEIISKLDDKIKNLKSEIKARLEKKTWWQDFEIVEEGNNPSRIYIRKKSWTKVIEEVAKAAIGEAEDPTKYTHYRDGLSFGIECISLKGIFGIKDKNRDNKFHARLRFGPIAIDEDKSKKNSLRKSLIKIFEKGFNDGKKTKYKFFCYNDKDPIDSNILSLQIWQELSVKEEEQKEWVKSIDKIENSTFVEKIIKIFEKFSDSTNDLDQRIDTPEIKEIMEIMNEIMKKGIKKRKELEDHFRKRNDLETQNSKNNKQ